MCKFKCLIFCIFIIQLSTMNAQTDFCGTIPMPDLPGSGWENMDQTAINSNLSNNPRYVFNVRFWDVNEDDGTNNVVLTETQALDAIARLNSDFNALNVFFKYTGILPLNATEFTEIDYANDEWIPFFNFVTIPDAQRYEVGNVNIYSVDDINANVLAYYLRHPDGLAHTIVAKNNVITNVHHLTHEMGHYFFLGHVFGPNVFGVYENVIREPDPYGCFNALTAGDRVLDANATPEGMQYDINCNYVSQGEVDSCGVVYNAFGLEPEVKNFMGYAHDCVDEFIFTPGQIARMHYLLATWDHHPTVFLYNSVDVSELYKPYRGEYYLAGPNLHNPPLFQYGFKYKFYDTSQAAVYNQPSAYENTSFWHGQVVQVYNEDYNTPIEHKNHTAFVIAEVEETPPRMCYNNYNRSPKDGKVIKFLDGVPNANVMITSQDSLQINNTDLIQGLQPGLYNIQKNYDDGTTEQTMILKENN